MSTQTQYTMVDAMAVERQQPERFSFEQYAAIRKAGGLSELKEHLYGELYQVSREIESTRASLKSRASTAHDEMIRLVAACNRGETRLHYTGWADGISALTEKMYQLDERFDALERLLDRSDVVTVADVAAAPVVEHIEKQLRKAIWNRTNGRTEEMNGRNRELRDKGHCDAVAAQATIDTLVGLYAELIGGTPDVENL